jgi:3-oxoacyl-[acyl-carrier-protein] synthase-3
MVVRQDVKLLSTGIHEIMHEALVTLREKRGLDPSSIDWYLPHLSSYFFGGALTSQMAKSGFLVPEERWFTNLRTRGNTGAASFYVILAEALEKGLLKPGQKVLAMIPESGRFIMAHCLFTVVGPGGEA